MLTETQIIKSLKSGREEAIEELIEQYGDIALKAAYGITGDRSAAEEIVQDTFLQVLRKIEYFRGESSLKTWIIRIAVNLAKNSLRTPWFRRVKFSLTAGYLAGPEDGPEEISIQKENNAFVIRTLQKIPLKYREVLVLFYFEEFSTREISLMLRQPEGTIKSKLNRGRKLLKKEIETGLGDVLWTGLTRE